MKYKVGDQFLFDWDGGTGLYEVMAISNGEYDVQCWAHTSPYYRYLEKILAAGNVDKDSIPWTLVNDHLPKTIEEIELQAPQISFDREEPTDDYGDTWEILKQF